MGTGWLRMVAGIATLSGIALLMAAALPDISLEIKSLDAFGGRNRTALTVDKESRL
ncbi:MAG TPA: hypothetical protein VG206_10575 [Terriglobia bacterium]|nr:hypothetical protein [Terriglobia bacterium]